MRKERITKGWVFVYGVDGFGEDIAPAHEEGCYTNFNKAFEHLMELNHDAIVNAEYDFYEEGYGIDSYPENDKELAEAYESGDFELFERLMDKHILTDERQINELCINCEYCLFYGMYGLDEIDIIIYDEED